MVKAQKKYWSYLFFYGLFAGYLTVTLFLFHRQSVNYDGRYFSDISSYIAESMGISTGYDFPYPIMFWIAKLLIPFGGPYHAMALAVTGLNGLTVLILKHYFDRYLHVERGERRDYAATVLVYLQLFVSMLFSFGYLGRYKELEEDFLYRYRGVFSPNPFHNATYLAARPFAVIAFFLAADILQEYEHTDRWFSRKYFVFSAVLLLATMTKPSFTLVLVSLCGVVMLWRLLGSKWKTAKAFWQFGIAFIPTFLALLYQYGGVFIGEAGGEEKGIGIGFLTAWKTTTDNVLLSILLGSAFPLSVLLFQRGKIRANRLLLFSWQFFVTALLMLAFLYEKGYRMPHMNFAWGYMYGLFFLFLASLITLVQETGQRTQPVWQLGLQWMVFAAHLLCGADYFRVVISGGFYY